MMTTLEGKDWRKTKFVVVKNVVNQGTWKNCWVIVGLRVWEAIYTINNPIAPSVELSPQHVIDCVFNVIKKPDASKRPELFDKYGFCASPVTGVEFMMRCGVHLNSDYGWKDGVFMCEDRSQAMVGKVQGYIGKSFVWHNIDDLMRVLDKHPIGAYVLTSNKFCAHRGGDVYFHKYKGDYNQDTNHAVLVIGYGYDFKIHKEYFLIQNSWGTEWGEDGFARIDPLALHYPCTLHVPMLVDIGSRDNARLFFYQNSTIMESLCFGVSSVVCCISSELGAPRHFITKIAFLLKVFSGYSWTNLHVNLLCNLYYES